MSAPAPHVVTPGLLRSWSLPNPEGDKNASGRVLIVGGNERMPGAVLLAAEAAMRAGAGKLQIATVASVTAALGVAIPEGYVVGLPTDEAGDIAVEAAGQVVELAGDCDAVLLGPGMMSPDGAAALLGAVVPKLASTVAIDALGMAYLTDNLDGVAHLAGRCVLSPNITELFFTLSGEEAPDDAADDLDLLADTVRELAAATGAVVVSGGGTSFIADAAQECWRDETGGQGLAISGSGDVKAGIIAGLLARGASPAQAAVWADYVHGRCGERLSSEFGLRGFMARDLLPLIPRVIAELEY